MKRILLCLVFFVVGGLSIALSAPLQKHNYAPDRGYVSDAKTAISIAVAIWSPIYGEKHIQNKKPFKARLYKDVWTVEGSLPKGWRGGVPVAEISKRDGRILRVSHGK